MKLSRRRALTITAATGASMLASGNLARELVFTWTGTALGADARITVAGLSHREAIQAVELAQNEVERLESAFSLYRPDSELSRLNRDGYLDHPSQDFRQLLGQSLTASEQTLGFFNPAIQPIWSFLAKHFAGGGRDGPDPTDIKRILERCDPTRISLSPSRTEVAPGMALTFNGIAQGYVTDAVARIFESHGLRDILINLGEIFALPGRNWDIAVAGGNRHLAMSDHAAAQSAGRGTVFTPDGRWHHLIDPSTGRSANQFASVTVTAATATEADFLSTALYVAARPQHVEIMRNFPNASSYLKDDSS
ncbi:MAG: FAD:protein FMN transferase [Hyphomicrobiales bacterium]|nr:FAD:protein FMN transferase [Hyphomicrobiales bacterium]